MVIQSYFIDKKRKKFNKNDIQNGDLQKIKYLAVFTDDESKFNKQHLKKLKKKLQLEDDQINMLTFKKKNSAVNEFGGTFIEKKDFNWFAKIKKQEIKKYFDKKYDLFIDCSSSEEEIKQFIVQKINANLKVSHSFKESNLYNLSIDVDEEDYDTYIDELLKYLKILNLI